MNDNITFTSAIRPIKTSLFEDLISDISKRHSVNSPWTCAESRRGKQVYTTGIIDCTMCGITDGKDVFMMHICPTKPENAKFSKIKEFMQDKIDFTNKNLKAVVLGARFYPDSNKSYKLFDNFVKFLKSKNVDTTTLKCGDIYAQVDVLYRKDRDEWLIASKYLDSYVDKLPPGTALKKLFKEIELSKSDMILP